MRKGMLEYCVLLLLKNRPSYASDIIQQLKAAELLVVEGTLYPLLTRLKNDGLLRYRMAGIHTGAATKILCAERHRSTVSGGAQRSLVRTL